MAARHDFNKITNIETVLVAIAQAGSNIREREIAASQAYVRFALGHPDRVQVMFRSVDRTKYPSLVEAAEISLNQYPNYLYPNYRENLV